MGWVVWNRNRNWTVENVENNILYAPLDMDWNPVLQLWCYCLSLCVIHLEHSVNGVAWNWATMAVTILERDIFYSPVATDTGTCVALPFSFDKSTLILQDLDQISLFWDFLSFAVYVSLGFSRKETGAYSNWVIWGGFIKGLFTKVWSGYMEVTRERWQDAGVRNIRAQKGRGRVSSL